jgi:hypothetical protein
LNGADLRGDAPASLPQPDSLGLDVRLANNPAELFILFPKESGIIREALP